jgi:isopentenyl-diphosphate delta-isomerase
MARRTRTPQQPVVVLVSETGAAVGTMTKLAAHRAPGRLHRAFSVLLLDSSGRLLIQRRARTKYHFAGLWSNSCCGHPAPGQDVLDAASIRLADELGLAVPPGRLRRIGAVVYRAADPVSGLVEWEFDHVVVGSVRGRPDPNDAEVEEVAFVSLDDLERTGPSGDFTAWFPTVLRAALPELRALSAERSPV